MYISLGCSKSELGCRSMLKFTLLEVGISFAASCPTMTSCSSASSRPLVTSSASSLCLSCDLNPPNYCSNRVPSRCHGRRIAFYSVYQEEGGGGENRACCGVEMWSILCLGRPGACAPRSHFNDPGMHANLGQNVDSRYLVTNANKFWNQSCKMWNKKSDP